MVAPELAARPGRRRLVTVLTVVLLVVAGAALVRQWDDLADQLARMSWPWVVASAALAVPAVAGSAWAWRALLVGFGGVLPVRTAAGVFFAGQLGKYVPGGVWTVVAHAEVGRVHGADRMATASASVASMLVTLGTGVPAAAVVLPFTGAGAAGRYWWLALAVVACAVGVQPRVIDWGMRTLARLTRREVRVTRLSRRALAISIGWSVVVWVLYGLHLYCLGRAVGAGGADLLARSIGGFALAWCVGFVVVVAPAGLGVREAALVVALGPAVPPGAALAMAVVSRVVLSVVDVIWGSVGVLVLLRRGRPAAMASSPGPPDPPAAPR